MRISFVNDFKFRKFEEDDEDLWDLEIKRISESFGDEGCERL